MAAVIARSQYCDTLKIHGLDFHYNFACDLKKLIENMNSKFKRVSEISRAAQVRAVCYIRCYTFPPTFKKEKALEK